MTPYYSDDTVTLHHGDCLDVLRQLPDASVDAVCTDPPYALEFMGRAWDGWSTPAAFQEWCTQWATECLRVLKPGGHMVAFGGSRTWHRLAAAVEDAGFEIRDSIAWLYGSGFPKSLDVSKAIDKAAGAEREVVGRYQPPNGKAWNLANDEARANIGPVGHSDRAASLNITAPATPDAERWQGWGTALKPAFEPIVVGRKPLDGTVAANVLQHGTGALNIDGCRVTTDEKIAAHHGTKGGVVGFTRGGSGGYALGDAGKITHSAGRWPTNVALDDAQAAALDEMSGERSAGGRPASAGIASQPGAANGTMGGGWAGTDRTEREVLDGGGASRFFPTFRYEVKAPASERPFYYRPTCECEDAWPSSSPSAPVTGTSAVRGGRSTDDAARATSQGWSATSVCGECGAPTRREAHATVKPLSLMSWLVRLVTPPGGTVLEPFAGSGTAVEACVAEGFSCIAIEREADYLPLIMRRIERRDPTAPAPVELATGVVQDGFDFGGVAS